MEVDGGGHFGLKLAVCAACRRGVRGPAALLTAAATAAIQEGLAQGPADAQEEHRGDGALEEGRELVDEAQEVQGLPGELGGEVGHHDIADVLGERTKGIDHGQAHHSAVELALTLLVLARPTLGLPARRAPHPPRHKLAGDGEKDGQTEVAAEVPPHASILVGHHQRVDGLG